MSDRAEGVSRAALIPWMARAVISWPPLSAKPLSRDAAVNRDRPVRKTLRLDNRSAIRPPRSSPPPDIMRYAVTSHWRSPPRRFSARPIEGSAVLTTEMSSTTRIWAARATPSRAQDFFEPSSSPWDSRA